MFGYDVVFRTRDPRLQPERTALAWQRTLFSVFVLALASTRFRFSPAATGGFRGDCRYRSRANRYTGDRRAKSAAVRRRKHSINDICFHHDKTLVERRTRLRSYFWQVSGGLEPVGEGVV
ncbi:DUF202 domain-containing protein [Klebsiella pneumoniae]|nr:DUF202 domain-containing protein [Klebsiella pneumoniae]